MSHPQFVERGLCLLALLSSLFNASLALYARHSQGATLEGRTELLLEVDDDHRRRCEARPGAPLETPPPPLPGDEARRRERSSGPDRDGLPVSRQLDAAMEQRGIAYGE